MSYLEAVVMGIVQGLTEFLPVSSSGHLVMVQFLTGHEPKEYLLFDLLLHLGTVGAIIIYFRDSLRKYAGHLRRSLALVRRDPLGSYRQSASVRFTVLAVTATFATFVFYVLLKDWVESGFEQPIVVAICWLVTGTLLLVTDARRQARRGLRQFGIVAALAIGLAQGFALFPGISRSGATICAAVLIGLHRRWAGEFSFLIGSVAIILATILKGMELFNTGGETFRANTAAMLGPMFAGTLVSMAVGVAALALLFWALRRAHLRYFAFYCYLLSIASLVILLGGG